MPKAARMHGPELTPLQTFLWAAGISSLGGLAALLRSNKDLTPRAICTAILYSGALGMIIAMLWFNYHREQGSIYFMLGISGLAGIGGATVLDFIVMVLKKGGVKIVIAPDGENANDVP